MTEETTNDIIKEAFDNLPKVVQDVLTSSDLSEKLQAMAKKHNLHLDKWSLLENEIALALLGITDPKDLQVNIKDHVDIDEETAVQLANNAVEIVFDPIRVELEKAVQENTTKEGVSIPIEQKQTLEAMGETIPKTVTETQPQTIEGIIKNRMQQAATVKQQGVTITAFNQPAQTPVGRGALPDDLQTPPAQQAPEKPKETLTKNTAENSSYVRKTIDGDPYREQV